MNARRLLRLSVAATFVLLVTQDGAGGASAPPAKTAPLLTRALPDIDGKEVVMLTVEYPPGGSSSPHRHHANAFVYVLEGSIVMQVEGGKAVALKPGDTFYESPSDIHSVSRNASDSAPAKFLVIFVKDVGAPPLVPVE